MQFPVNLDLVGRPCLLVGAGRVGLRKARQLLACGADLTVIAPEVHHALDALGVRVVRRRYRRGDLDGVWLVVTATGDRAVDQQIFDEATRRRIWVNSADDPARCSFTLPAVLRQGPVMVTVSTGGASPALSSWLREQLERVIGPEFAEVASALATERARLHAAGRSTEDVDWRPLVEAAVATHGPRPIAAPQALDAVR